MNLCNNYGKSGTGKYKEDTTSKTQYIEKDINNKDKNGIKQLEDEIRHQKDDILKFQTTFTLMKQEIYSLREENKELKVTKYESTQISKNKAANVVTEKKESETQTEPTLREGESKADASYKILKFRQIKCRYF